MHADGEDTDSDATVDYRGDSLLALVAGDDDVLIRLPSSFGVPSLVPLDGDGFASWLTKQDKNQGGHYHSRDAAQVCEGNSCC